MHKVRIIIGFDKATIIADGFSDPMGKNHFIEKVQLMSGKEVLLNKTLTSEDSPKVIFQTKNLSVKQLQGLKARVFCNLHGAIES
jgi:desulfoferrodoxin (superoxide reductase-like protein)